MLRWVSILGIDVLRWVSISGTEELLRWVSMSGTGVGFVKDFTPY